MVHKHQKHCIQEFIGISERIAILRVQLNKTTTTTIIQVYAPTESNPEEEIEAFYEDLDGAINKYEAQGVFVMDDFSSKIGKRKKEEALIGPYGIGNRNKRGERLIQFSQEHNLFILNSYYKNPHQLNGHGNRQMGKLVTK